MANSANDIQTLTLSGYDDRKQLLAQRFTRDGKSLFVVALPIHLVATHLPVPDPNQPFEGNRRVNETHATKFGEYWREGASDRARRTREWYLRARDDLAAAVS